MEYKIIFKNDKESIKVSNDLRKLINKEESNNPDVVFSVGGDGTFLDAVRMHLDVLDKVYFVSIHTGTLGFYTEFLPHELKNIIDNLKHKTLNEFNLLKIDVDGEVNYALNEVTLTSQQHLLEGDVYVNKEHLMFVRANGLCISTPSGSTAYNKSLNGAILDFNVNALQLALIAPFETVDSRIISPLVLSKENEIIFKPKNKYFDITYDRMFMSMEDINTVKVSYSNKYVKYMINPKKSYINRLKEKFIGK
ncbi:MAG: NAD(+)/NADH kinase [Acholeplasmatales bacterium]